MKKIFPIITILIFLSLVGLIVFQILWIQGSLETEELKFREHIIFATRQAADDLMQEKGNMMPMMKKKSGIFPGERLKMEFFKPTIIQRYSRDEIKYIIRKAFDKENLKNIPFEFAVGTTSIIGDEIQSENYFKLKSDSANNKLLIILL